METKTRAVRKDVLRNRALLLESADAVIRERGMELSLNAVAHHARVGVGTVYRHFPNREALITAMFEQRAGWVCEILESHLHDTDPVDGLREAVIDICTMQASDRGVWEVISSSSRDRYREIGQAKLVPLTRKLVRRANATGRLRMKFEPNDLAVLLWAGGALNNYLRAASPTGWLRYVLLMFDSFLADDDPARRPILQRAPSVEQIEAAMQDWRPA